MVNSFHSDYLTWCVTSFTRRYVNSLSNCRHFLPRWSTPMNAGWNRRTIIRIALTAFCHVSNLTVQVMSLPLFRHWLKECHCCLSLIKGVILLWFISLIIRTTLIFLSSMMKVIKLPFIPLMKRMTLQQILSLLKEWHYCLFLRYWSQ